MLFSPPPATNLPSHSSLGSTVHGPAPKSAPLICLPICGPLPVQVHSRALPSYWHEDISCVCACLCLLPVVPPDLALDRAQVSSKQQVERSTKGERQEETWNFSNDPPPTFLHSCQLSSSPCSLCFPTSPPPTLPVTRVPFSTAILRTSSLFSLDLHGIMSRDTDHFLLEVRPMGSGVRPA